MATQPPHCWALDCGKCPIAKCSACKTAAYCGVHCQRAHWAAHKLPCAELVAAASAAAAVAADAATMPPIGAVAEGADSASPLAPDAPFQAAIESHVQDWHCALGACGAVLAGASSSTLCACCLTVAYCGAECQGAHWEAHVGACFKAVRARVLGGAVHQDDKGEFVLRERLLWCKTVYGTFDARTLDCMRILGLLLASLGRLGEAETLFRELLASARASANAAARAVGAGGANQPAMPDLFIGAGGFVEDYHCALGSCGAVLIGGAVCRNVVCPGCCAVGYCNRACQVLDWQTHRPLCACVWAASAAHPPPLPLPQQPSPDKAAALDYTGLSDRQLRTELLRHGVRADALAQRSELLAAMVSYCLSIPWQQGFFLTLSRSTLHAPRCTLPPPTPTTFLYRLCLTLWTAQCVTLSCRVRSRGSAATATFTAVWNALIAAQKGTPSIPRLRLWRRLRMQGRIVLVLEVVRALPQMLATLMRSTAWLPVLFICLIYAALARVLPQILVTLMRSTAWLLINWPILICVALARALPQMPVTLMRRPAWILEQITLVS